MAQVLLAANPGKRRKKHHRKGRMPAALRRYWATHRRGGKKHRARRRASAVSNPHRRRRHHYYRNPSLRNVQHMIMPTLKAGAWGAAGGLSMDLLWGFTSKFLPASMTAAPSLQNPIGYATKALYAILTGVIANMVLKGKGTAFANGAMTVVLHDAGKSLLQSMVPSLPLGEYLSDYASIAPIVGSSSSPLFTRRPLSAFDYRVPIGEYLSGYGYASNIGDANYANGIPVGSV